MNQTYTRFALFALAGTPFEPRPVGAMTLRTAPGIQHDA